MSWPWHQQTAELCQVCLDVLPLTDTTTLSACGHRFCVACISTFLIVQITDGETDLRCFSHNDAGVCGVSIEPRDVERLVAPDMFAKYERFVMAKDNNQTRQCPFCDHAQITQGTVEEPRCVCSQCQQVFCFTHSNAHDESETCKQYERRVKRGEKKSGRVVGKISKPCPKCSRPIEKNGGCLHMRCSVCKTPFCWSCGKEWTFNYRSHHDPLDIQSCSRIAEHIEPTLASPCRPVRWLARAAYYVMMLVIAVPLTLAFCWIWVPYAIFRDDFALLSRFRVLTVYFAVMLTQGTVMVGYITALAVVLLAKLVFECAVFVGACILWPFQVLSRTMKAACCSRQEQTASDEKTSESTTFTVLEDADRRS